MRYWFPHPILSLCLMMMWLLLNRSLSPGHIALGATLGTVFAWVMVNLEPRTVAFGRIAAVFTLAGRVFVDVLVSHVNVTKVIFTGRGRVPADGFLTIRLRIEDENALACLSLILTLTPGTAWLEYDPRDGTLLMHALDLETSRHIEDMIHQRYEGPLREIFQ
ncbi:Na+/H+ antiporter subunit E [Ensifer soli]|uniref:Na+/H+ antiporter subunit E n=1 Tax=Ciceribacter sp. sgz301302 TaxID=3342379 RepID=UPI0035B9D5D7